MTYTLVVVMLLTGKVYIEGDSLGLQDCATRAAIIRQGFIGMQHKQPQILKHIVFRCLPELDVSSNR
jgi:hypothetical protein